MSKIYILAVDNNDQLQQLINKGAVFGTVAPGLQQRVNTIIQIAQSILAGQTPQACTYVPFASVT